MTKYLRNRYVQTAAVIIAGLAGLLMGGVEAAAYGAMGIGVGIGIGGMILDSHLLLSDAQQVTSTGPSTNVIDLSSDRNIGMGEPLAVLLTIDVAPDDSDGNETYTAALQSDSDGAFGTAVTLYSFSIPAGTPAGTMYALPVPPDDRTSRYLRLLYTLGGTSPSMTVTAALMPQSMIDKRAIYPSGFSIS